MTTTPAPKRKTAAELLRENAQFRVRERFVWRADRPAPSWHSPQWSEWGYYQTERGMRSPQTSIAARANAKPGAFNGHYEFEVEKRDPATGDWTPIPGYAW